jgi:leukotriene-A4 hydrolase
MLKSLDSYEFKTCVFDFFRPDAEAYEKIDNVDWDAWYHTPGTPPKPSFDTSMVEACYALSDKWKDPSAFGFAPRASDISGWTANQSVVFLERVQGFPAPPLPVSEFRQMGRVYGYAESANVELVARYYSVGLMCGDMDVKQPTGELLGSVGRMKFVRPLFTLLAQSDREYALSVFEANKTFYHPICRAMIERDLKLK